MIVFTARQMSGGTGHEHVSALEWKDTVQGTSNSMDIDRATKWLDTAGSRAYVEDRARPGHYVEAHVVKPAAGGRWHIRTAADGRWTDNLLALPERWLMAA